VVGEGTSQVVELRDPTAHVEVMALRAAGAGDYGVIAIAIGSPGTGIGFSGVLVAVRIGVTV
jgi:hypothetical protein